MKRTRINQISKKRSKQMSLYRELLEDIRPKDNRSELSHKLPEAGQADWRSGYRLEPHHIRGRIGLALIDPFNIIFLTPTEHDYYQSRMNDDTKSFLESVVEPIRMKQGYVKE